MIWISVTVNISINDMEMLQDLVLPCVPFRFWFKDPNAAAYVLFFIWNDARSSQLLVSEGEQ